MNHTTLLVGILLTLGIPLAATLASTFSAYGQQLSSPSSPSASSPDTTTISAKLKADLCNPSNPGLKVVNTTEARICNIPKTVKNTTTSSSLPSSPTTSISVASPATTPAAGSATQVSSKVNPKQQVATTNNSNVPLGTNSATISAPYDTTSNVNNKPIPSSSPTTTVAPQVGVVSQGNVTHPQQSPPPIISTVSNGTNVQDNTPLSVSPLPGSDKLVYLGYNTGTGASTGTDLTGKSTANTKPSTGKHDNDSTDKGNSSTKPSHTNDSGKSKPSHTNDSGKSKPSHTNDSGKSKPSSKSKDHNDHEGSGSNKAKKSSSKGEKSHRGGDSFFGHDPFF